MKKTTNRTGRDHASSRGQRKLAGRVAVERLGPRLLMAGDVLASVYQDVNGNGLKDAGDVPMAGWTLFVDVNGNGARDAAEPQQVTGANGQATFLAVADGTYDVVEVVKPGFTTAPGFKVSKRVSVNKNPSSVLFMNQALTGGAIQGTVWNDINADGVRQAGDPALSGWTVYLDTNTNRRLDAGEPTATTDASGFYSFAGLAPGAYRVREVLQSGYSATTGFNAGVEVSLPNTGGVVVQDFGNFNAASVGSIAGTVWNDVNADGLRAAGDAALSGWTVYLDANANGVPDAGEPTAVTDANGAYQFPVLFPGSYNLREVVQPTWLVSPAFHNPAVVTVVGGAETVTAFGNFTPVAGTASGTVYNDVAGNGFDAADPGLAGWTVYVDANANGVPDAGETSTVTAADGTYTLTGLPLGSSVVREVPAVGWKALTPGTGAQLLTLLNGATVNNVNFGNQQRTDGSIGGTVYADANHNGVRDPDEHGLAGVTVYLDANGNGALDAGEPTVVSSVDLFYTPAVDEAGSYTFTHLATGPYTVREIVPAVLSGTPAGVASQSVALLTGEARTGVDFADQYRANEIRGVRFNDLNGNHARDPGEPAIPGVTIYLDLNRNNVRDAGEPSTVTAADGSYAFTGLAAGAYVVRDELPAGHNHTYPTTGGGILWPAGASNPASGNVTPTRITTSLAQGETFTQTVSLTLPNGGAITNKADVFLLFDDTGSFTANSPIVRAAFPQIISSLQAGLPGLDLGFGVGRFEEYGNFAAELGTGRPFILNQPIVSSATAGFATSIQAALDRTAPGYGGDQPETDIEALYQMVTGAGFDGNNNGTTTDSGAAGLVATQLTPGNSGDVPAFSSFTPDVAGSVLPAQGTIGGAGFRDGALPIILLATDTGFAYQPQGEATITGVGGVTVPLSQLTQTSRPSTPFSSGAGIQQTVTGLNALGALVIGLGTNAQTNVDPRQDLEALARLTGATNQSPAPVANGTATPIAPGDPLYFQIASGFGASVANGVTSAIQSAATSVAVDVTLRASDPRVHIAFTPGAVTGLTAGQTATFSVTFTGDGLPHRFDLQFVRAGTSVVLGSIPVVLGTPIAGDGYEFEDLPEGEVHAHEDFGSHQAAYAGSATGRAFDDRNGNGALDAGEAGLAGASVYADLNNSGTPDSGEPTAVTAADGTYALAALPDGAYVVRQLAGGARAATTDGATVAILGPTPVAGADLGSVPTRFTPAAAGGSYAVRGTGTVTQIWLDAPTTSAATYTVATGRLNGLAFADSGGDDSLTVDLSQGAPLATGSITFDAGGGTDALAVMGTAGDDAVSATAGTVTVNGLVIAVTGLEGVTLEPGGGTDSLAVAGRSVAIRAVAGGGVTGRRFSDVTIGAGGTVSVATPPNHADRAVLVTSALALSATATLDLGGNDLIVRAGDPAAIAALVHGGMNAPAGYWNGPGIDSAAAASDARFLTGLGVMLNDDGAGHPIYSAALPFDGVATTATDVLVKSTYYGDANLDGVVNAADYTRLDAGFVLHRDGWADGDFNYDGVVDGSDYALADNAFNQQSGGVAAPAKADVPVAPLRPGITPPSITSAVSGHTSPSLATLARAIDRKASPFAATAPITAAGQSSWAAADSDAFWTKRERGWPAEVV